MFYCGRGEDAIGVALIKPVAIAVFAILLLAIPVIVRNDYYMHIAILTGLNIMLVCGVNMIQGYSGRVTLGHHAFLGIGAYTAALLALRLGTPWWLDMILAGVLAAYLIERGLIRDEKTAYQMVILLFILALLFGLYGRKKYACGECGQLVAGGDRFCPKCKCAFK